MLILLTRINDGDFYEEVSVNTSQIEYISEYTNNKTQVKGSTIRFSSGASLNVKQSLKEIHSLSKGSIRLL